MRQVRPARRDAGFSLVEVTIVMFVALAIAATAMTKASRLFGNLRLSGDARAVATTLGFAKMRAAADFTRVRIRVDRVAKTYSIDFYIKTTASWYSGGGAILSYGVQVSPGSATTPPPNSQSVLAQAPPCLDNSGAPMSNTSCVIFNSRGVPVDDTGQPVGTDAIYLTDGTAVYAVTVSATGLIRYWRTWPGSNQWSLR